MESQDLIKLIENAKNGENHSFELLCFRYQKYINVMSRNNFINGADTDDIIQNGYIGLWRGIKSFNENKVTNIDAFFKMCIKREIYTAMTTANRKKHLYLSDSKSIDAMVYEDSGKNLNFADAILGTDKSAEDQVILKIEERDLEKYIIASTFKLSSIERKCIMLLIKGFKQREIAQHLNLNKKQVDNALTRGKKQFREKAKYFMARNEAINRG